MTKQVVKAGTAGEFLMLVPKLLGFNPRESVVIVPFKDNRTIGAMRFDIPPAGDERKSTVTMSGMLCKVPDADAAAVIVYTGDNAARAEQVIAPMIERIHDAGLRVVDALYIAEDGWGSYMDPSGPRPLADLYVEDETLGEVLDPTRLPLVAQAHRQATVSSTHGVQDIADLVLYNEDVLNLDPSALSPSQGKTISQILERPALRDIAIVQWTVGQHAGEEALDAQLEWEAGTEYPAHLAMHMWGEGPRPDASRLERGLELSRWVVATIPTAGGYSMCAWLSWALGRSTHAEHYANEGLKLDPEHGLCQIVASFVTAGHLPNWAFTRPEDDES